MRKYIFILSMLALIVGCQQSDHGVIQPSQTNGIAVQDGRLSFATSDQFVATLADVEKGKLKVIDNKLANLDYQSYKSTLNGLTIDQSQNILGATGLQLLLNANREVRVGDKIYNIDRDVTSVYSMEGQLIESTPNKTEVFDRNKRKFVQVDPNASARTVSSWAYFPVTVAPYPYSNYEIADQFYRQGAGGLAVYYRYQWKLTRTDGGQVQNATYWQINYGSCICQSAIQPPQQVYYNIWTGTITIGVSSLSYEAANGYALSMFSDIQLSDYTPVFQWSSQVP